MSDVITKDYAILNGLRYFNTGRPCKHGHYSRRYTISGSCKECGQVYYDNHKEKIEKNKLK